ncbi:hypothetical protein [Streptomyces sp. NPDC021020]
MTVRGRTAAALDAYLVVEDGAGFPLTPLTSEPGPATSWSDGW